MLSMLVVIIYLLYTVLNFENSRIYNLCYLHNAIIFLESDKVKQNEKKLVRKFISIVVSLVTIFIVFAVFAVYVFKKTMPEQQKQVIKDVESESEIEQPKPTEENLGVFQPPTKTNILIVGTDQSESLTDVILVGSFDRNTKRFNIITIPRDTYTVPSKSTIEELKKMGHLLPSVVKINEVHSYAGRDILYTQRQIEELLNIKIDYYVKINLLAFRKIVDGVGGIYMDIPKPGLYYNDPLQDLVIAVPPGKQVLLNGELAEGVVRFRSSYANGDEGRIDVQHVFMKEFFKQVLNKKTIIDNMGTLLTTFISYVKTDYGIENLPKYLQYLGDIKGENFYFYKLPGEADYIDGVSYYISEPVETAELVNKLFYQTEFVDELEEVVSSKDLNIKILNGSGVSGKANTKRAELEAKGFKILNTDVYEGNFKTETRIMVSSEKYGQDLVEYFKDAVIEVDSSMPKENDIIIIVGKGE